MLIPNKSREELRIQLLEIRKRQKKLQEDAKLKSLSIKNNCTIFDIDSLIGILGVSLGLSKDDWSAPMSKIGLSALSHYPSRFTSSPKKSESNYICPDCKNTRKITLLTSIVDCLNCK